MIPKRRFPSLLELGKRYSLQSITFVFLVECSVVCFGASTVPTTESEDAEMLKNIELLKHMDLLQNFDLIEGQSNIDQASTNPTIPSSNPSNPNPKGKSL